MKSIYGKACELTSGGVPGRHTFYQLKHFVLGKEVTTQAKLQKCLRELDARKTSVKSMMMGIEEAGDDVRIIELKIAALEKKKAKSELDKEYRDIQKRKLFRKREALLESMDEMRRKLGETEEEMDFFIEAYQQLELIEPLRRHDDPEANAEYWNENFAQEMHLRIMLQRPLDLELVKCILALDKDSSTRKEMVGMLEQIQQRALGAPEVSRIEDVK
jgi:uncharacterized protein YihD (DUF1040 family)